MLTSMNMIKQQPPPQSSMQDPREIDINLSAIRRSDPSANQILDKATQVALYSYVAESGKWEKSETDGSLFVYRRADKPSHAFIVLNRLSTENLKETVAPGLQVQAQPPYLLYRTGNGAIQGIWFFDQHDCLRIASLLRCLTEGRDPSPSIPLTSKPVSDVAGLLATMQQRNGAAEQHQQQQNSNRKVKRNASGASNTGQAPPIVHRSHSTTAANAKPISMEELFNQSHVAGAQPPHPDNMPEPLAKLFGTTPIASSGESGAAVGVEALERSLKAKLSIGATGNTSQSQRNGLIHTSPHSSGAIQTGNSGSRYPVNLQSQQQNHFSPIPEPPTDILSSQHQPQFHLSPSTSKQTAQSTLLAPGDLIKGVNPKPPIMGVPTAPQPPSSQALNELVLEDDWLANERMQKSSKNKSVSPSSVSQHATALSPDQLLLALQHLLKTDQSFLHRLHTAYVEALQEQLGAGGSSTGSQ